MSLPRAYVARECAGQVRFKVPEKKRDTTFFARAGKLLAECPGVESVELNLLTGSFLVLHATDTAALADYAREQELFRLVGRPFGMSPAEAGAEPIDLRVPLTVLFAFLGLIQLARGQVLGPASTLLWTAMQLSGQRGGSTGPSPDEPPTEAADS